MVLKLNKRVFLYALVFFFLNRAFMFNFIISYELINTIYLLISEIITVIVVLKFIIHCFNNKSFSIAKYIVIVAIVLYYTYYFLDSMVLETNIRRVLMVAYPVIGTVAFLYNESDNHFNELVKGISLLLKLSIILTLIDAVFIKHFFINVVSQYLIGGRNQLAITLSISMSFFAAEHEINNSGDIVSKRRYYFPVFLYLFLIVILGAFSSSATVLLCLGIMILLYFLFLRNKRINSTWFLLLYSVGWFLLIIIRLQSLLSSLIVTVLHRDITFSHRTLIWDAALKKIAEKPLFGYGSPDSYNVFNVHHDFTGHNNDVWVLISAHNQILQLLYCGGIILVILYFIVYFLSCKYTTTSKLAYIFYISVIVIMVTWLSEVPGEYSCFLMLAITYISGRQTVLSNSKGVING